MFVAKSCVTMDFVKREFTFNRERIRAIVRLVTNTLGEKKIVDVDL